MGPLANIHKYSDEATQEMAQGGKEKDITSMSGMWDVLFFFIFYFNIENVHHVELDPLLRNWKNKHLPDSQR